MKRFFMMIAGISLISGCVTTAEFDPLLSPGSILSQPTDLDRYGELRLIKRGTDIFLESDDGCTRRRVTSDPYVEGGSFTKDGKNIVYLTSGPQAKRYVSDIIDVYADAFFLQPVQGDEGKSREITFEEYQAFILEKISAF